MIISDRSCVGEKRAPTNCTENPLRGSNTSLDIPENVHPDFHGLFAHPLCIFNLFPLYSSVRERLLLRPYCIYVVSVTSALHQTLRTRSETATAPSRLNLGSNNNCIIYDFVISFVVGSQTRFRVNQQNKKLISHF